MEIKVTTTDYGYLPLNEIATCNVGDKQKQLHLLCSLLFPTL